MKYVRRDSIVEARVVEEKEPYFNMEGRKHTALPESVHVTYPNGSSSYYPDELFHRVFIPADEVCLE